MTDGLTATTRTAAEPDSTVPAAAIEAVELAKTYGDVNAVDGVSFRVTAGEIFAYLGRNGSGKTTTVRMLTTLSRPSSGTARVAGHDIADARRVRARIGVTMQDAALDPAMTAAQHLRLVAGFWGMRRAAAATRSSTLLEAFGLTEAANRRISTFSGGMQRRLDIATALISEPPVLFLDEPTTGLDPQSRRALWAHLRELRERGVSIFLTTQYLEEADELADRVAIIDHGRILVQGTPARLRATLGRTSLMFDHDSGPDILTEALPGVRVEDDNGRATITLGGQSPDVMNVLDRVRAAGVTIRRLVVSEASLEAVFLRLTGSDINTRQDQLDAGSPR